MQTNKRKVNKIMQKYFKCIGNEPQESSRIGNMISAPQLAWIEYHQITYKRIVTARMRTKRFG